MLPFLALSVAIYLDMKDMSQFACLFQNYRHLWKIWARYGTLKTSKLPPWFVWARRMVAAYPPEQGPELTELTVTCSYCHVNCLQFPNLECLVTKSSLVRVSASLKRLHFLTGFVYPIHIEQAPNLTHVKAMGFFCSDFTGWSHLQEVEGYLLGQTTIFPKTVHKLCLTANHKIELHGLDQVEDLMLEWPTSLLPFDHAPKLTKFGMTVEGGCFHLDSFPLRELTIKANKYIKVQCPPTLSTVWVNTKGGKIIVSNHTQVHLTGSCQIIRV